MSLRNKYQREQCILVKVTLTDRIGINPRIMLGKAVIRGTRIPVVLILRKLSGHASEADLLFAYPSLRREGIQAATRWRT
jgi:uncharacterized protein (DUF433 family)